MRDDQEARINKQSFGEEVSDVSSSFGALSNLPSFEKHMEQLRNEEQIPQHDMELQQIYDDSGLGENDDGLWILAERLSEYNKSSKMPCLASGQSGYFNKQIDTSGFTRQLRLEQQDIEDAKYVAKAFGKTVNYGDNGLSILYMTLPGTVEMNYAMQTFPAGIYEDVFQGGATHVLPIRPLAGEQENEYWRRVLNDRMMSHEFSDDERKEIMMRGGRLIDNFCNNRNRIYFLPFQDLARNKASFGDVPGLRDGSMPADFVQQELEQCPSFDELLEQESIENVTDAYYNPNFTSEYGIAVYGDIDSKNAKYIEVGRIFDVIQKCAMTAGVKLGEPIPDDVAVELI